MAQQRASRLARAFMVLAIAGGALSVAAIPAAGATGNEFVKQTGPELRLHGNVYRFAGSNNYYLMYKSQFMVDDVLETAAAQGFDVLRIWGSLDIGNQDGSNSIRGKADGVYFHYWDGTKPAFNDGPDGLQRLDYVVAKARELGIRLVIPFVNNWNDFGGIDQYVRWNGGGYHDDFYTNATIRQWYRDWIAHLLNRTNTITGLRYKDDSTIMTWELANEPRCVSAGAYPRSASCTTGTLVAWADEMSTFIKSIDPKHLVSVGDEGFYCTPGAADWTENCGEGVDTIAFTKLENVDVMSFHLYPSSWSKDAAWSTSWIARHFADARALDKPAMLGEYGWLDKATRNPIYKTWTDTVVTSKGAGALYWILSGRETETTWYADYDGFTVYCPSPVCTTIANFAVEQKAGALKYFAPVADNDTAVTEFETAVSIDAAANDVAYAPATLDAASIDLDPVAAGRQTTVSGAAGTWAAGDDGTVVYTPATGFVGKTTATYVISDTKGGVSNPATLSATVKPAPAAPILLYSFETGTEGWAPANWQANAGTVAQDATHATNGTYSLRVDTVDGGWFGPSSMPLVDVSAKTKLKWDLTTTNAGTSVSAAVQLGDAWTWCQGTWGWVNAGTSATQELDLLSLGCASPELDKVHGLYIWFSGGGTFYIDNVRAE